MVLAPNRSILQRYEQYEDENGLNLTRKVMIRCELSMDINWTCNNDIVAKCYQIIKRTESCLAVTDKR